MPEITCKRCGQVRERMEAPPLKSAIGTEIQDNVCAECFEQWRAQETMVINEYRLRLFDRGDRAKLDHACRQFLGLVEGDTPQVDYTPPAKG